MLIIMLGLQFMAVRFRVKKHREKLEVVARRALDHTGMISLDDILLQLQVLYNEICKFSQHKFKCIMIIIYDINTTE